MSKDSRLPYYTISSPEPNVKIQIGDSPRCLYIYIYKEKGFNWFNRKMMKWCLGWKVTND